MAETSNLVRSQRERLTADVRAADALKKQYANYLFSPERVSVEYVANPDGSWRVVSIELWGPRVLRSGLPAERSTGCNKYSAVWLRDAPSWAREFADQHLPEGAH